MICKVRPVGTSHSDISRLDCGRRNTSVETLQWVAGALGVRLVLSSESGPRKAPVCEPVGVHRRVGQPTSDCVIGLGLSPVGATRRRDPGRGPAVDPEGRPLLGPPLEPVTRRRFASVSVSSLERCGRDGRPPTQPTVYPLSPRSDAKLDAYRPQLHVRDRFFQESMQPHIAERRSSVLPGRHSGSAGGTPGVTAPAAGSGEARMRQVACRD